jgi:hypothetical protein
MKKKLGGAVFAAAAVGAMLVAPAGAAGHVPPTNTNSVAYWEYKLDMDCTKISYGYPVGEKYWIVDGDFGAVVVKGGSVALEEGDDYYAHGARGVALYSPADDGTKVMAPLNNGNRQAAISWIMTCDPGSSYPS